MTKSGIFQIQPDGLPGAGREGPMTVYCNFENGEAQAAVISNKNRLCSKTCGLDQLFIYISGIVNGGKSKLTEETATMLTGYHPKVNW